MKFNDKKYWEEFYEEVLQKSRLLNPTPFSEFVLDHYLSKNERLVELGSGNGRDSIYFAKNDIQVTSIDQCANVIQNLSHYKNITAYSLDFTNLQRFETKFDVVYSRFTLHSIDLEGENRTIVWSYDNLKTRGRLCIEARTLKDPIYGKGEYKGTNTWFYNNHHRRFIDAEKFRVKLEKIGFKVLIFKEERGFAKMGDDNDPVILRLIVEK